MRNIYWAAVPIFSFLLWRWHVGQVNSAAPDWGFMLSYNRFTDMNYWYFGDWSMRLDPDLWDNVFQRIKIEITGWLGSVLAFIGLLFSVRNTNGRFAILWLIGALIYLAIFFNLNVRHNYYQIPFIAPLALLMAIGMVRIFSVFPKLKWIPVLGCVFIFGNQSYQASEFRYFREPTVQQAIAKFIEETSKPNDLVIISNGSSSPQFPNILYAAHRTGWSYPIDLQNPTVLYKLKDEGAKKAYLISRNTHLWGEMGRMFQNTHGSKRISIIELGLNVFVIPL